ncbi:GNAT family N-acetyltransferase [Labedella endophytica]|uniref:GNAT family N-acetyltransferase n=1 Tax=Labedella endophytica TaxID=1523160 RepID=A0A433JTT7_9MICO|nr:GNAT family N-acetyltransferase [Labedella endophytica]RUR01455.1 GNAT family N-acetyltransferase [Labedella endophytica]
MLIREVVPGDRDAVARICRVTGRGGDDATGDYGDDDVLADVYATPYLEHPSGFGVVAVAESGEVVGYLIGTTDTETFARWFVADWWPRVSGTKEPRTAADESLFRGAIDTNRMLVSHRERYPAHLHIDLLEEARGGGVGRRLVEAALVTLRRRGVPGVHLVVGASNTGAVAFYERTGFTALLDDVASVPGESIVFARDVPGADRSP